MMEKDYEDFACKNDALAGTALKREDGMRKPVYRNISAGGKEANRRRWGCSIANFSRFSKKFAMGSSRMKPNARRLSVLGRVSLRCHLHVASWKDSRIVKRIFSDSQPIGVFPIPTTLRNRRSGLLG
jgi:hypothetical protein